MITKKKIFPGIKDKIDEEFSNGNFLAFLLDSIVYKV